VISKAALRPVADGILVRPGANDPRGRSRDRVRAGRPRGSGHPRSGRPATRRSTRSTRGQGPGRLVREGRPGTAALRSWPRRTPRSCGPPGRGGGGPSRAGLPMIAATSGAAATPASGDSMSSRIRRASTSSTCSAPSWFPRGLLSQDRGEDLELVSDDERLPWMGFAWASHQPRTTTSTPTPALMARLHMAEAVPLRV
jgi:hypothetical protein